MTQRLKRYTIGVPPPTLPLSVWDTRGWARRANDGADDYATGELNYLLEGNLREGMELDGAITSDSEGFRAAPTYAQRMHVVM